MLRASVRAHQSDTSFSIPKPYIMSSRASMEHSQVIEEEPLTSCLSAHQLKKQREKMVKFSKQFEAQLVPEWKDAFVDYWQLKKDLKKIHLLNINNNTPTHNSSLSNTLFTSIKKFSLFGHQHREHELIHVLLDHSLLIYPCYCYILYNDELMLWS